MTALIQDVRYCLATLRAHPGFAALAILTLALGVGANTAVFSIVHAVLLRPLAFADPDRLVTISPHDPRDPPTSLNATSAATFYDWRAQTTAFEAIAAFDEVAMTLTGRGEPQRVTGVVSAANVLQVLGVRPALGRWFTEDEDAYGAAGAIVISYDSWQRLFGGSPQVLGQSLTLGDRPYSIVGVMPHGFAFPNADTQFWMAGQFNPELRHSRTEYFLIAVGRLRADRSVQQATAELNGVMARLRSALPDVQDPNVLLAPLKQMYTSDVQRQLLLLMAAVGVVLLIACANLANVLLARASGRGREVAVRQALGASAWRIARQLLTESATLGVIGGIAGLIVGIWSVQSLIALLPEDLPRRDEIRLDGFILFVTLGVSLIVGLVFGLAPAWRLSHESGATMLRAALGDGARATVGRGRLRGLLVIAEVALALILLMGAGLLIRSFNALRRVDPGVRVAGVQTFRVQLPASQTPPAQRLAFFETALERIGRLPGVESVAIINNPPVTGRGIGAWLNIVGRPTPPGRNPDAVPYRVVSTSYFDTMGVPLLRGRLPTADDTRTHSPSVVIDKALAARYWPNEDPIGRDIVLGALPDNVLFPRATIVGVVGDVRQLGLHLGSPGMVYVPHRLMPGWNGFAFMVRTRGDQSSIVPAARAEIRSLNPLLPVSMVQTMEEIVVRSMSGVRSSTLLLGTFAALALAMAVIGIFGVLSFVVSQRYREMGIRLALGAEPARLVRSTIAEGMRHVTAGIVLGVFGAVLLTRTMSALLYGVTPTDPITFVSVIAVVSALSLLACYLPARRATQVDPVSVLRAD